MLLFSWERTVRTGVTLRVAVMSDISVARLRGRTPARAGESPLKFARSSNMRAGVLMRDVS